LPPPPTNNFKAKKTQKKTFERNMRRISTRDFVLIMLMLLLDIQLAMFQDVQECGIQFIEDFIEKDNCRSLDRE